MSVWKELSVAADEGSATSAVVVLAVRVLGFGALSEVGDVGIVDATLSGGGGLTSRVEASRTAPLWA